MELARLSAKRRSISTGRLSKEQARMLINGHYTKKYGPQVRMETPRSMRVKIIELEAHMDVVRDASPLMFQVLARQCVDFERICALQELLS